MGNKELAGISNSYNLYYRFLGLRKLWYNRTKRVYPEEAIVSFKLQRVHFAIIFFGALAGVEALFAGNRVMKARINTFVKNNALIENVFGDIHRKELGENAKLSKYG